MMMNSFGEDFSETDCSNDILRTLRYTLDASEDWYVLVQWDEDEHLVSYRNEEIQNANRAIEDAAVTNFAEMLRDYISGLDEGEGMGAEDLKDKLYEYLNWDKKYTPAYENGRKNFKF